MTLAEFKTLVGQYLAHEGKPLDEWGSAPNTVVADSLELFSQLTWCLFSDTIDILTTGTASDVGWLYGNEPLYDLMDEGFYNPDSLGYARRVFWPLNVIVGDRPLLDLRGNPGPVSFQDMQALDPYGTARVEHADIRCWCRVHPHSIRLFPAPLTTINNSGVVTGVVPGWYLHPRLSSDGQALYLPPGSVRTAAAFTASYALEQKAPFAVLQRLRALDARQAHEMQQMIASAQAFIVGQRFGPVPMLPSAAQVLEGGA